MNNQQQDRNVRAPLEYEPPRIETVLTAEDLQREAQYAGAPISNE